jgi:hypothetical protein
MLATLLSQKNASITVGNAARAAENPTPSFQAMGPKRASGGYQKYSKRPDIAELMRRLTK